MSKPDFRHWLDSVDTQLEAIHGFEYPDLVLAKVKRLTHEVTSVDLEQIISEINEANAKPMSIPPGMQPHTPRPGGTDPWANYGMSGPGGAQAKTILIDHTNWDFAEKARCYTHLFHGQP